MLKKIKRFGYPECDHLNIALRFLFRKPEENVSAIKEIYYTIIKTNGYFYRDVAERLKTEFGYECKNVK